jgi:hypothetical protein
MNKSTRPTKQLEFEPDAWERFERAVKVVAKSPPQHKVRFKKEEAIKKPKSRTKQRQGPPAG